LENAVMESIIGMLNQMVSLETQHPMATSIEILTME
jgi:hypothetical protein